MYQLMPAGSLARCRRFELHQKQLDKVRENYTYTSLQTTQDMDSAAR
jgi:hypothetical protein